MSFVQFKLDRSFEQSRGIFNKYIYITPDTIAQVLAAGYFAKSRFVTIDGPTNDRQGWVGALIDCICSDGYFLGAVQSDGSVNNIVSPAGAFIVQRFSGSDTIGATTDLALSTGTHTLTMPTVNSEILEIKSITGTITLAPGSNTIENGNTVDTTMSRRFFLDGTAWIEL